MTALVWGPTIDSELCDGCRACLDFCRQGVYDFAEDKVEVVEKDGCIPGCSHCAGLCDNGAISFPPLDELRRMRAEATG